MRPRIVAFVRALSVVAATLLLGACRTGLNAGGESPTNNGGIAFMVFTAMLIAICVILWLIMGRED